MPVIRTIFWETVLFISIKKKIVLNKNISDIRTYFYTPNDVLITGIITNNKPRSCYTNCVLLTVFI